MGKMKWIIVMAMLFAAMAYSMQYETKLVNGYKVVKGERPAIDYSKIPQESYEKGKIRIKLKPDLPKDLDQRHLVASTKGFVVTGIASFDKVNETIKAHRYTRKLDNLYEVANPGRVNEFRERHKAWGFHLWREIEFDENTDVLEAVKMFKGLYEVEFAEPMVKIRLNSPVETDHSSEIFHQLPKSSGEPKLSPNDPYYNQQYAFPLINAPDAWEITSGNPNIIVAIVDQGVQFNHPDLAANMWSGIGPDGTSTTYDFHGTHVAGTVAAVTNNGVGVAGCAGGDGTPDSGVKIMSCDIFDGSVNDFTSQAYAADNGAMISQNSWGWGGPDYYSGLDLDGIDYFNVNGGGNALDGGLVIFAAGNDNDDGAWYPAYYSGCMAVASTDNNDIKSSFSNYGTWVDISAPGSNIMSTYTTSTYNSISGTSMACPHVSGIASAIVSLTEGILTREELWQLLVNSVQDIDALNPTYAGKLGSGRIDFKKAADEGETYLGGVPTSGAIVASGTSTSQINLSWTLNEFNDNVLVAWALEGNAIGTPVNGTVYSVGNSIPGGGTVKYYGNLTSNSHTGLTAETAYDYKIWSRAGAERQDNQGEWYQIGTYSNSKAASAETLMAPIPPSASSLGFENSGYIPNGWTQDGSWTFVTSATRPTAPSEGSYFAYFNATNSTKKIVTPRFDLTTHTGVTINFDYLVSSRKSGPTTYFDKLKVYYKTSLGGSWVLLSPEYSGAYTTWQTATLNISDAVRTDDFYFAFEAIEGAAIGYGVSVDDIVINGTPVGGTPPAAPSLISPANTSSTTDLTPTFDWGDVSGATSYTIQIDNTSNFSSPEYTNSPTASTYTPASNLPTGTWYWRVLATNANGSSAYTSGWSVILGSAPTAPTLAAPTNASTLYIQKPVFDWNDVSGATSYTILADNNATFVSPEINETVAVSNYTPASDMALGTYFWKVLSTNSFGSSAYSSTWSVILAPLTAPINVITTPGATDITVSWDAVVGATSYDVYSSEDPYGTFTFVTNVATNSYVTTPAGAKLFWYVVAKN